MKAINTIIKIFDVKKKSEIVNLISPEEVKKSFIKNIYIKSIASPKKYTGKSTNQSEDHIVYLVDNKKLSNSCKKNWLKP